MHVDIKKKQAGIKSIEKGLEESRARRHLRIILCGCFYYSGLIGLICWWKQLLEPRLLILNYHEATGGDLRRHLLYLRKYYRIEPLVTALESFYKQPRQSKKSRDQRIPLVMTFDDGYYDNYTHGLALAKELCVPLTIFLIPGYIENGHRFWWNEAKSIDRFVQLPMVAFEGHKYHLDQPVERAALLKLIDTRVRYAATVGEREQFLEMVHQTLGIPAACPEEQVHLPVTWEEVQKMEASGWISFGAHTMHHPFLGYLTHVDEVVSEVVEGREALQQKLGHPVVTFAYPGGQPEQIGAYGQHAARQAGFDWALTTTQGVNRRDTDPLMLRRIEVNLSDHWLVMAAKTSGLLGFFLRLRQLPRAFLKTLKEKKKADHYVDFGTCSD